MTYEAATETLIWIVWLLLSMSLTSSGAYDM